MGEGTESFLATIELNESRECVQSIEQEVRLELHLQRLEMGDRQLALQFEGAHGVALGSELGVDGGAGKPNDRVKQKFNAETGDRKNTQTGVRRLFHRGSVTGDHVDEQLKKTRVKQHGGDAGCEMKPQ